jgi:hypothetical protein
MILASRLRRWRNKVMRFLNLEIVIVIRDRGYPSVE